VIILMTFQVLFEISGLVLTLLCPPCRGVIPVSWMVSDNGTYFSDSSWAENPRTYKDYSGIASSHYSIYVLPHILSGVVPRMVDGFKCITQDQMVLEYLQEWKELVGSLKHDPREHIILPLSEAYIKHPKVMEILEKNLDEALILRRTHCTTKEDSIVFLELGAMVGSAVSAILIMAISAYPKLPRLHIPWMIFSAFEITGNLCVSAAFIIFPGLPYLICILCMTKVLLLRWVWVKVVRRQMHQQIDQNDKYIDLMIKEDFERKLLRTHLDQKGKVRLSRCLGSYA